MGYEIKNPHDYPIYLKINTVFKNENDEAIGTVQDYVRCIGPGEYALLYSFNESHFTGLSYNKDIKKKSNYISAQPYMTHTVVQSNRKQTYTVKNSSASTINYAKITVAYFKGEEVISVSKSYLGDSGTIPGGGTVYEDIYMPDGCDSYRVYFNRIHWLVVQYTPK